MKDNLGSGLSDHDGLDSRGGKLVKTGPAATSAWPARYELLDGLRGLAALAVVIHHVGIVEDGHFAVMVFFVISGYCITASAESSLRAESGFSAFMIKRVRRIYPPYLLALLFFVVTRILKGAGHPHSIFSRPPVDWLQNITLTQWLSDLVHPVLWPGQNPQLFVAAFWSLNYEEQFYLVMGLCLLAVVRLRIPLVIPVLALGAVGIVWNWLVPGNWICGLFIEYWAHFALGSTLYFVLCRYTAAAYRRAFIAGVLVIGLFCGARIVLHPADAYDAMRAMVELTFLAGVCLTLYCLRPFSARISASRLWRPVAALGTISYSLYLIHQFNLNLIATIAHRVLPGESPQFLTWTLIVSLHVALGTVFWSLCERPFLRRPAPATCAGIPRAFPT